MAIRWQHYSVSAQELSSGAVPSVNAEPRVVAHGSISVPHLAFVDGLFPRRLMKLQRFHWRSRTGSHCGAKVHRDEIHCGDIGPRPQNRSHGETVKVKTKKK